MKSLLSIGLPLIPTNSAKRDKSVPRPCSIESASVSPAENKRLLQQIFRELTEYCDTQLIATALSPPRV